MPDLTYTTAGSIKVQRRTRLVDAAVATENLIDRLDERRGALYASNYEYPGRHNRWSRGFVDPPLVLEGRGRNVSLVALNDRGTCLLDVLEPVVASVEGIGELNRSTHAISTTTGKPTRRFTEEERSKQPSTFGVVRAIQQVFSAPDDSCLGFYGAFGYDLVLQFEDIETVQQRHGERDLVLYLADDIVVIDHASEMAQRHTYDFEWDEFSTVGVERNNQPAPYTAAEAPAVLRDHAPGEYAAMVEKAKESFRCGDLFEVTPSQSLHRAGPQAPSQVFRRIRAANPTPYSALINLGDNEFLIGGSPEMFIRAKDDRIETSPIAGTIARGDDALGDAQAVVELLTSQKAESELTMCTDVDRNDKARVCIPESIKVIGRRQIELYSRVIHTVDHVEGTLRPGFDALDGFLSHMWAVTVTGAPKLWAMRFIEEHERSPRRWYGGAIGFVGFDGSLNTGITIRTVHLDQGVATVRAGATTLIDSDPEEEENECQMKASAFLDAIANDVPQRTSLVVPAVDSEPVRVLLVDHEDSFVHTLASYLRRAGAEVTTVRAPLSEQHFAQLADDLQPRLVCLSPGPGEPSDFDVARTVNLATERNIGVFGVCLGLQAIVENYGGRLGTLDYPMHGKQSLINNNGGQMLSGLPASFTAGRYHSLFALDSEVPDALEVTARSSDGVVMAVEHKTLSVGAVQFHPESILSADGEVGLRLIANVLRKLVRT